MFAIISVLIIYIKILRKSHSNSHHLLIKYMSSNFQSKNLFFVKNILITTVTQINSQTLIETDIILLLKLLETYLFKIYIKDMDHIVSSLKIMNLSDFIMENLFLFAEVYDHTKNSIRKFRVKVNWNFCEISVNLYNDIFPKFVKKTIYRHLNYVPNDDSFLYYAIQYYYTNKDYQKANLLINKIITKEDKSDLLKDTQSICYLMLANIKIYKESYGEALDIAICNLERIKEIKSKRKVFNDEILWRNYFVLGFCYSKLGDNTINYQEKNKYSQLALASFKIALEGDVLNPIFIFFYARQLYELKNFLQAEEILSKLDEANNTNSNHVAIFNFSRALRVLINIALLKFDYALTLCNQYQKTVKEIRSYSILVTLKHYLEIFKLINFSANSINEEEVLINKMSESCEKICNGFDSEITNIDSFMNRFNLKSKRSESKIITGAGTQSNKIPSSNLNNTTTVLTEKQIILKELIKSVYIEPNKQIEIIKDEELKASSKIYIHEKKNLESARIEFLKNFFILADILRSYGFDREKVLVTKLSNLVFKAFYNNEDLNTLIIVFIFDKFFRKQSN